MKVIEEFKIELKWSTKNKKRGNKAETSKLLNDLNIGKGIKIDEIKRIEAKLEKLKIPKRVINTIIADGFCEYYYLYDQELKKMKQIIQPYFNEIPNNVC